MGGWAEIRVARFCSERKPKVEAWKVTVSRDASWVKEWFISSFPNGPHCSLLAVGKVNFQWGPCGQEGARAGANLPLNGGLESICMALLIWR